MRYRPPNTYVLSARDSSSFNVLPVTQTKNRDSYFSDSSPSAAYSAAPPNSALDTAYESLPSARLRSAIVTSP